MSRSTCTSIRMNISYVHKLDFPESGWGIALSTKAVVQVLGVFELSKNGIMSGS